MPSSSAICRQPIIEHANVDAGQVQRGLLLAELAAEHHAAEEARARAEEARARQTACETLEHELAGLDGCYRTLLSDLTASDPSVWIRSGEFSMTAVWMVSPGLTLRALVRTDEERVLALKLERTIKGTFSSDPSVENLDVLHTPRGSLAAFAARYMEDHLTVSS